MLVRRYTADAEWVAWRPTETVDDPRGLLNTTTVESEA